MTAVEVMAHQLLIVRGGNMLTKRMFQEPPAAIHSGLKLDEFRDTAA